MKTGKYLILISLYITILFCNCTQDKFGNANFEDMTIFQYLQNSESDLNITIAALILSKEIYPEIRFEHYINIIKRIALNAEMSLGRYYVNENNKPYLQIYTIANALHEYGFEFDQNDFNGRNYNNHFLVGVVDRKKGICTTLPLLYVVVAEKMGIPIYPVEAPNHIFCRYILNDNTGDMSYINIVATAHGKEIPDVSYIDDMQIPFKTYKNGVYLRTLTKKEYIGTLLTTSAIYFLNQKNMDKAVAYLEKSKILHPKNTFNRQVLSSCYKQLCNEAENKEKNIEYYFKAKYEDRDIEEYGITPRCPENYWEKYFNQNKTNSDIKIISRKGKNGIIYHEPEGYQEMIKKLEAKYSDYFK